MAAPAVGPKPVTTFSTPSGIPALAKKSSINIIFNEKEIVVIC